MKQGFIVIKKNAYVTECYDCEAYVDGYCCEPHGDHYNTRCGDGFTCDYATERCEIDPDEGRDER